MQFVVLLLLLPTRSGITHIKLFVILYNKTGMCYLKVANRYTWQGPFTLWL